MHEEFQVIASTDNTIGFEDFCKVLRHVLPSWKEEEGLLRRIFDAFDVNKANAIAFKELMLALSILYSGSLHEQLTLCFNSYDTNHNGYLRREEVHVMMEQLYGIQGKKADIAFVNEMFEALDSGHDGVLNFDEFAQIATLQPVLLDCFRIPSKTRKSIQRQTSAANFPLPEAIPNRRRLSSLHLVPVSQRPLSSSGTTSQRDIRPEEEQTEVNEEEEDESALSNCPCCWLF